MTLTDLLLSFEPAHDWSAVWAASGAMPLSGRPDGDPLPVPVRLVSLVSVAARVVGELSADSGTAVVVDGPALLAERAALMGLIRRGDSSCGGGTRLLRTTDGWVAVSLAREADCEAVPAWLELAGPGSGDAEQLWEFVSAAAATRSATFLVRRAALLGMPCSRYNEPGRRQPLILAERLHGMSAPCVASDAVVVDLSSMWAGPLCANLLGLAGARVVKIESVNRPDGARAGDPAFFDLLHGGHESVALDVTTDQGRRALIRLISAADVVIEASRPRALEQLGISPSRADRPKVWLRITGHGREGDQASRVAFGDDAAVAGGLATEDDQGLCFCSDAVADPITGLIAAAAILDRMAAAGRWTIDLALSRTSAWAARGQRTSSNGAAVAVPRHRPVVSRARERGADTDAVIRALTQ